MMGAFTKEVCEPPADPVSVVEDGMMAVAGVAQQKAFVALSQGPVQHGVQRACSPGRCEFLWR